ALIKQLEPLGINSKPQMLSRFMEVYRQMWGLNGDHVSKIYAGTGALGGGRSKAKDAARSATRTIQNNFMDRSKQEAIDILLLGSALNSELADKARALLSTNSLHASPSILHEMVSRHYEYTSPVPIRVAVGTWNVNGGQHFRSIAFKHESMDDWLLDARAMNKKKTDKLLSFDEPCEDLQSPIDIYAIGFEEIVDLNASNIMSASTSNQNVWGKELQKTISREHKYVLLTSTQLVGVCLFVFVRPHLAPFIRDVAIDTVKTGLGGKTGNKGGVAIRFLLHSTSICFVCSHFAAGQSNVAERNSDFKDFVKKIAFPMGRTLSSHDYVFWCGDFNYRIDLPNDEVKQLVKAENWSALQACDQLIQQKEAGNTFNGYNEGLPNFAPTYKYDLFCQDYDTSEKKRTPAWTDRVLWRRRDLPRKSDCDLPPPCPGKLLLYDRAELKTSDHRPVIAIIEAEILEVNEDLRESIYQEVISIQGPPDGTAIVTLANQKEFSDEVIDGILTMFAEVGEVILVRFVDDGMWLTFRNGQLALQALHCDGKEVEGTTLKVALKTKGWMKQLLKEFEMGQSNTKALYSATTNSLLGEDFNIPSLSFDIDDEDEEVMSLQASSNNGTPLGSGRNTPVTSESPCFDGAPGGPPSRPGPPPSRQEPPDRPIDAESPQLTSDTTQPPDVLIQPEFEISLGGPPPQVTQEPKKAGPPPRPGAPPSRPPPPSRSMPPPSNTAPPSGAPIKPPSSPVRQRKAEAALKSQQTKSKPMLRPHMMSKFKALTAKPLTHGNAGAAVISRPTTMTHTAHATNEMEAQKLIERLMNQSMDQDLPPPLMPKA
ncbi:unnamed protein product, partial [Owenia fusiformis]